VERALLAIQVPPSRHARGAAGQWKVAWVHAKLPLARDPGGSNRIPARIVRAAVGSEVLGARVQRRVWRVVR
ncbi:hypothetical protein EBU02_14045, partial [bacterium]|nr:hypothetical protein [bacterium]